MIEVGLDDPHDIRLMVKIGKCKLQLLQLLLRLLSCIIPQQCPADLSSQVNNNFYYLLLNKLHQLCVNLWL